jgi:hypothetical protein
MPVLQSHCTRLSTPSVFLCVLAGFGHSVFQTLRSVARCSANICSSPRKWIHGFAGATLFLLFLEPILAFVRAVPSDIWNGWFLLLGLAVAGFSIFSAYVELTRPDLTRRMSGGRVDEEWTENL